MSLILTYDYKKWLKLWLKNSPSVLPDYFAFARKKDIALTFCVLIVYRFIEHIPFKIGVLDLLEYLLKKKNKFSFFGLGLANEIWYCHFEALPIFHIFVFLLVFYFKTEHSNNFRA